MSEPDPLQRLRDVSGVAQVFAPEVVASILEQLPDALIVVAEDGRMVYLNHQCELLFGYPKSMLLGQSVETLIPEALRSSHQRHREHFFTEPKSRPMGYGLSLQGRRANGTSVEIEINLSPIVTSHGMYALAIVRKRRTDAPATP